MSNKLPIWGGLFINGSQREARFELTDQFLRRSSQDKPEFKANPEFQRRLLRHIQPHFGTVTQPQTATCSARRGQDSVLCFAHDLETFAGARIEFAGGNANTLYVFMCGVGVVVQFSLRNEWVIRSAFPFTLRMERPAGDLRQVRDQAVALMVEAYEAYARAFASFMVRFKLDLADPTSYRARLVEATLHDDALNALRKFGADQKLSPDFFGYALSAQICDGLSIPMLPYRDDALAGNIAPFYDDMRAVMNASPVGEADLRFSFRLRSITKERFDNRQMGVTVLRRTAVFRLRVDELVGDRPLQTNTIFQTFAEMRLDDRIPIGSTEDDTPDRDVIFFDRLIGRIMERLLSGIRKEDSAALAELGIHAPPMMESIKVLNRKCAAVRRVGMLTS